jgi:anaerobic selenocysteine-containing dehydrogenase
MSTADRREFMKRSAVAAGAASVAGLMATQEAGSAEPKAKKVVVAACGLSCSACPLMEAGKCKGCAPGDKASAEMVEKKNCPVLTCANMKKIAYCGTGCKGYTKCAKLIGRPYDKDFMKMIESKLNP